MHAYDAKDLERLFGLPAAAVRSLTRAGHLRPIRLSGRLHYSFQDLLVLRTARALRAANMSAQRINRTLRTLRASQVASREGTLPVDSDSGQYLMALVVTARPAQLYDMGRSRGEAQPDDAADDQYRIAFALEESNPVAAIVAYRTCLAANSTSPCCLMIWVAPRMR